MSILQRAIDSSVEEMSEAVSDGLHLGIQPWPDRPPWAPLSCILILTASEEDMNGKKKKVEESGGG